MGIEDTIAYSPSISVNTETIGKIEKDNRGYRINIRGTGGRLDIRIGLNGESFVKGLKPGDRILTIVQSDMYVALYGPIEDGKLYKTKN